MEPSLEVCRELSLEVSDVGCAFAIAFPDPSTLLRMVNKKIIYIREVSRFMQAT